MLAKHKLLALSMMALSMSESMGQVYEVTESPRPSKKRPKKHKGVNTTTVYRSSDIPYKSPEKIGRNSICSCGSGLKFKKCCISKS